jgi:hypothetical protein
MERLRGNTGQGLSDRERRITNSIAARTIKEETSATIARTGLVNDIMMGGISISRFIEAAAIGETMEPRLRQGR